MKKGKSKSAAKKGKSGANGSIAEALMSTMVAVQLKRNNSCLSFVSLMKARKMNDRNTPWRNEWRNLIEEGFIKPANSKRSSRSNESGGTGIFTSTYELTDKGEDRAGSPDQKEIKRLMEMTVNTTTEHHARIKELCMNNRARAIFDLLLKHGSLTRKELAAIIGISDRGAPFSYGLRDLKEKGYIVVDVKNSQKGKKALKLSDKTFMDPKDRPEPIPVDPTMLSANMEKVYGKEMRKAAATRSSVKKEAIVKKEASVKKETDDNIKVESINDDVEHEEKKDDFLSEKVRTTEDRLCLVSKLRWRINLIFFFPFALVISE